MFYLVISTFFGNHGKFGSAVFVNGNSTATIENSTFRNGQAQRGGVSDLSYHSTIHISSSTFSENSAFQGGAINAQESSNLYINKSIFDNNKAYYGSALFIIDNSSSYVECSNFTSNVAEVAAAVYVQQNSNLTLGFSSFINNTGKDIAAIALTDHVFSKVYSVHFIENKADYGSILVIQNSCLDMETSELISNEGWYISCIRIANDSASTLQYTDFIMNVALNNSTALHIHSVGTINIWNVHNFTMSGCNFINNTSIWASALSARNVSYMHIHNSTFHGNIGSALWIQETRELIIEDCYLIKNRPNIFEEGTVLTLFNYTNGYISESYFIGNIAGDQSAIIIQEHSSLTMYRCHLENNTGSTGVAALKQVYLNVTDTKFVSNAAHEGAGIALEQGTAVFIERCMFLRNTAEIGSAIQGRNNVTIKIADTNFEENVSNQVGTVTVRRNGDITVEDCKFYSNVAGQGGAIHLSYHTNATIVETVFNGNRAGPKTTHKTKPLYNTPKLNQESDQITQPVGGAIVANGNVTLTLLLCHFVSNSAPYHDSFGGALLLMQDVSVTILSSIFELNAANMGGAICAQFNVTLLIEETFFSQNSARGNGGVIQAESNVSIVMSRANLSRNIADIVSTIDTRIQSSLQITESHFMGNVAETQISLLSALSSKVILENCQFFKNRANRLPLIFFEKSAAIINNTEIRDIGNETTNIIAATGSKLTILHCKFSNNTPQPPRRNPMTMLFDASLVVINRNTRLEIENCLFSRNYETIIVNAVSNCTVKVERCTITENYRIGLVLADKGNEIIFESTRIEYNLAIQSSGLINLFQETRLMDLFQESALLIRNSRVTNNSASQYGRSGIINGNGNTKISIRSSTFSSNTAIGDGGVISYRGGGLNSTIKVVDSNFLHNHATAQGAAMYIENCNIVIDSCIFEGNTSPVDSALSLVDIKNLRTSNTNFKSIRWPSIDTTQRKLENTTYRTYKTTFERQNETTRSFETDFIDNITILKIMAYHNQFDGSYTVSYEETPYASGQETFFLSFT